MAKAERRVREEGKLLPDDAQPMVTDELTEVPMKEGITPKAYNMVIPIAIMVLMMPIMLAYTGWPAAQAAFSVRKAPKASGERWFRPRRSAGTSR